MKYVCVIAVSELGFTLFSRSNDLKKTKIARRGFKLMDKICMLIVGRQGGNG